MTTTSSCENSFPILLREKNKTLSIKPVPFIDPLIPSNYHLGATMSSKQNMERVQEKTNYIFNELDKCFSESSLEGLHKIADGEPLSALSAIHAQVIVSDANEGLFMDEYETNALTTWNQQSKTWISRELDEKRNFSKIGVVSLYGIEYPNETSTEKKRYASILSLAEIITCVQK